MSRTKAQRAAAKRILRQPAGELKLVDFSKCQHPAWMTRAYRNNRYVVMINDNAQMTGGITAIKAMVQTHDDKPIKNHWREMQAIKNEVFGREATAIEYYPPESELIDQANIYWLWVLPGHALPKASTPEY